jgi:hypothetical protein
MISGKFESYKQFSEIHEDVFAELLSYTNHDDYDAMNNWIAQNLQGTDFLTLHYASRLIRESGDYFRIFADLVPNVDERIHRVKKRHLILLEPFALDDQLHLMNDKMIAMIDCDYVALLKKEDYLDNDNLGKTLFLPAIGTALFQREDFRTLDFFQSQFGFSLLECQSDVARYYYRESDTPFWIQTTLFVRHNMVTTDHDEHISLSWKPLDAIMLNYSQSKENYLREKNITLPDQAVFSEFCRIVDLCHQSSAEEKAVINMGLKQYQTFLNYQKIRDIVNQQPEELREELDFQSKKNKI